MNFMSDNAVGFVPEVLKAIENEANSKISNPYGDDDLTEKTEAFLKKFFENENIKVFFTQTGTSANALSLSSMATKTGAIFCSSVAHISLSEANAVEFYTGGSVLRHIKEKSGIIDINDLKNKISETSDSIHSAKAEVISITQATEYGTIYKLDEIKKISEIAKENNLLLHMDGARFLNAMLALKCTPADMTWKSGVDVLSFGTSKAGTLNGEMIVFFNTDLIKGNSFKRKMKQAGHVLSKGRFISAQILAFLENNVWQKYVDNANNMAKLLELQIKEMKVVKIAHSVDINHVFLTISEEKAKILSNKGFKFHFWEKDINGNSVYRFVMSFQTSKDDISNLSSAIGEINV